jgi:hypothetical protein
MEDKRLTTSIRPPNYQCQSFSDENGIVTCLNTCQRWPGIPVTLRQGSRVIEDSRRLRIV